MKTAKLVSGKMFNEPSSCGKIKEFLRSGLNLGMLVQYSERAAVVPRIANTVIVVG